MAAKRGSEKNRESKASSLQGDWKHVAVVALLAVAVFGTLIVGAVLQVDPDEFPSRRLTSAMQDPAITELKSVPQAETSGGRPAGETRASALLHTLTERAVRDRERLAAEDDSWVLQNMVACDENNLQRLIDRVGPEPRLHLLPFLFQDRACFRVCWGPYRSRRAAESAIAGLPAAVASLGAPSPKPVAEVVR